MDPRVDLSLRQRCAERVTVANAYDEEVGGVLFIAECRQEQVEALQAVAVASRDVHASAVPRGQSRQFDAQECGLQLIEPAVAPVAAFDVVLGRPAVLAQRPGARRNFAVRRDDRTAIAERPQVLGWIEAEASGQAERAGAFSAPRRAVRLRTVFDPPVSPAVARLRRSTRWRRDARTDESRRSP